ncbi:MAG: polysulfide reductase NrfD [Gammaproteobacteria bacterium]|nr:polysulfide reductase NrfD [Gammaproteobacteria bacterium]
MAATPAQRYTLIDGRGPAYIGLLAVLGALVLIGLACAYTMEHNGHVITGMSNQVVWGTPHVFAVFLIVAASGALNVASIASVFGRRHYKPLTRLSGLLAIALLVGGLSVLVLDLGRPDRLIVAMTYYNFKSIFAWNIFLYVGFMVVVAVYLWMMFERRMNRFSKPAGLVAFLWRLILTTGTGSIFGFLVARQAYDAAIMAPMFIIMSFAFGLAIFLLVLMSTGRPLGKQLLGRLANLLGVFVASVLYFSLVFHLTNLYATQHHGVERFILLDGGIYTVAFWVGHIIVGGLFPLLLLYVTPRRSPALIALAAILVILGGLAQVYVIIIGGQVYPLDLFPGREVSSSFFDGVVANYTPSLPELGLGVGGFALALAVVAVAVRVLPFLPEDLSDHAVDPNHVPEPAPRAVEAGDTSAA